MATALPARPRAVTGASWPLLLVAPRPWSARPRAVLPPRPISFPAQRLIRCKRAATCNKPSSTTLQPTASAPGLAVAAHVRGTVSHAGPNSQHPGPSTGTTMPAAISMGLSAATPVLGRGDDVADLSSRFGEFCITAATSRAQVARRGPGRDLARTQGAVHVRAPCREPQEPAQ